MYEVMRVKNSDQELRADLRAATAKWGKLPPVAAKGLKEMQVRYCFSLALGDLLYLDGGWYVTHSGLLRLANRVFQAAFDGSSKSSFIHHMRPHSSRTSNFRTARVRSTLRD